MRSRQVVNETNWPLLTGGRYSQVVVKSGLIVHSKWLQALMHVLVFNELDLNLNLNLNRKLLHVLVNKVNG